MISALYILDLKGKVILSRSYRDSVSSHHADSFIKSILEDEDEILGPICDADGVTHIHIKHNNLYFLAVSELNSDAMMVLNFLYKLIELLREYFKSVEEESIRDNFVVTYELLDEVLDFGYPQTTEAAVLKTYITQQGQELQRPAPAPMAITHQVLFHSPLPKYSTNEMFIDVIERVNMQMSLGGSPLHSEIIGAINLNTRLSGMPEVRLVFNDRINFAESTTTIAEGAVKDTKDIEVADVKLHQCVRLKTWEEKGTLAFIPPDGECELMSYRLYKPLKPLIHIESAVDKREGSRIEYLIKAKAQFKARTTANNITITIPVPSDCDSPDLKASVGEVKYLPESNTMAWSIKHLQGGQEVTLRAHFGLSSLSSDDRSKRPLSLVFEIPHVTASGLQVRQLKVMEKQGYKALPWVRYLTRSGDYSLKL